MIIDHLMQKSGVSFGTSGARGLVKDMTNPICYAYVTAFIQYLELINDFNNTDKIIIGGDLRPSTKRIMGVVIQAIRDKGYQPIFCGNIPSPAVMLYGLHCNCPSIMITGSHIPDDRNGIKFNKTAGEILKEDEREIRLQKIDLLENMDIEPLPEVDVTARNHYIRRYTDIFDRDFLNGLNIGIYQHSSVSREILVEIFKSLGANIVTLGISNEFIPVDTEAIREEDIFLAKKWSKEYNLDVIISTDGDGDRPLISDERGCWIPGDIVGILSSIFLDIDSISTPISSNSALELCNIFKHINRTKIGSPYVIESMNNASNSYNKVIGYEPNGGFLTNSTFIINNKELLPLPTRDAVLPMLCVILLAKKMNTKIIDQVNLLPKRFTASNKIGNFSNKKARQIINKYKKIDNINNDFESLYGLVESINETDGIRIKFNSGEVLHLRASGNAPEFRFYYEADSLMRLLEMKNLTHALFLKMNV